MPTNIVPYVDGITAMFILPKTILKIKTFTTFSNIRVMDKLFEEVDTMHSLMLNKYFLSLH
jgi:hypothetical protein